MSQLTEVIISVKISVPRAELEYHYDIEELKDKLKTEIELVCKKLCSTKTTVELTRVYAQPIIGT